MLRLDLTKAARADLRRIYAYTFGKWGEPQADTYLDALRQAMDRIAIGLTTATPLRSRHPDMFKLRQGRHLVIFQRRDDERILVVRVLHERMDIDAHLEGVDQTQS